MTTKIQDLSQTGRRLMSGRLRICAANSAKNPQEGLKAAAQQFETLFLQMVMKSMRDTVPDDGMLNSDQSKFYTSLARSADGPDIWRPAARVSVSQIDRAAVGPLPGRRCH
jgi:hypothetical protein